MQKLILLVVGAAWVAVLLPPLLRSRMDKRPSSSVTDFRRQLTTLQRTMPGGRAMAPMRTMARPLVSSQGRQRPVVHTELRGELDPVGGGGRSSHGAVARSHGTPVHAHHRRVHVHRRSQRQLVVQRRRNVVFMLTVFTAATLFLAFNTKSDVMIYAFVLSSVSLAGYCYKLAQLRHAEGVRSAHNTYYRAA
jgi:hypothetical protein